MWGGEEMPCNTGREGGWELLDRVIGKLNEAQIHVELRDNLVDSHQQPNGTECQAPKQRSVLCCAKHPGPALIVHCNDRDLGSGRANQIVVGLLVQRSALPEKGCDCLAPYPPLPRHPGFLMAETIPAH